MDPEDLYRRFEELKERFEAAADPGEPLAAEFDELASRAENVDQPGVEVIAREAERHASHIRTGFPPLEE